MNYTIRGRHNRHFEILSSSDALLGILDYPTWYAPRSAIVTHAGIPYEISPTGFFRNGFSVTSGDTKVGLMKFKGLGGMNIALEGLPTYTFRRVGFFNSYMGLFTEHGQEIVKITQTNKWAIWNFNYSVETDDNYTEGRNIVLLMLLIFCMNYLRSMSYAAG